ncbi:hypothetical protein [Halobaculum sp. EA56]|uniref:hypothetical protein n=1 Tax=Halobaculum sp. EA56 TaxID=3421648 RepID=UPI003EB93570
MTIVSETDLARTYNHPSYADAADVVADYERVQRYASHHPDHGRTRVGSALDLPPSRVRGWLGDGKPDAVRGIEAAREYGWFDIAPASQAGSNFAVAVAGIYTCGGISAGTYGPSWNPSTPEVRTRLEDALGHLGVGVTTRHERDPDRPTEVVPERDAVLFGRVLAGAGVHVGHASSVGPLPEWIESLPEATKALLGRIWIHERATKDPERTTVKLQMRSRTRSFKEHVAALVEHATGGSVTVTEQNIIIPAATAEQSPAVGFPS